MAVNSKHPKFIEKYNTANYQRKIVNHEAHDQRVMKTTVA